MLFTLLKFTMMNETSKLWYFCSLIFIVLAVGTSSGYDLDICREGGIVSDNVRLRFNTSTLSGSICACRLNLSGITFIDINTDALSLSNCSDGDTAFSVVKNQTFTFICNNNEIDVTSRQELFKEEFNKGDLLWLMVSITDDSPDLSGSLNVTSRETKDGSVGHHIIMNCYTPNKNIPGQPTTNESSGTVLPSTLTTLAFSTPEDISELSTISQIHSSTKSDENSDQTTHYNKSSISDDISTLGHEIMTPNQVSVTAIVGGTMSCFLVVIIFAVTIIFCRKRVSSKEKDKDRACHDQFQMPAVHDNNQTNNQISEEVCSSPQNIHQSNPLNSVNEDPECLSIENALYESTNSLQMSGFNSTMHKHSDAEQIKGSPLNQQSDPELIENTLNESTNSVRTTGSSSTLNQQPGDIPETQKTIGEVDVTGEGAHDPKETTTKEKPDFTLKHEISPSGDEYTLVTKANS